MQGLPTACVGETIADIVGNIKRTPMDPGFSYAAALKVMGVTPSTAGSDPYSGALAAIVYGALPTTAEPTNIETNSELFQANFANYPAFLPSVLPNAQNGLTALRSYQDIVNSLAQGTGGVVLPITFFSSFLGVSETGVLPMPTGAISEHCTAVYEATDAGLRTKMWLGPNYGDGGYVYIPEPLFSTIFSGTAWGFNPSANRWLNLVSILLTNWSLFSDIYPQLSSLRA